MPLLDLSTDLVMLTLEKIDAWFDANAFENVDASAVKAKVAELRGAR